MRWTRRIFNRTFYGILTLATISGLGMAGISRLVPPPATPVAAIDPFQLNPRTALGLQFNSPVEWPNPVMLSDHQIVLSPTGSSDTSPTASPFVFIITDALDQLKTDLAFRDDYPTPVTQLDALIDAFNIDNIRFRAATVVPDSRYPAATAFGFQRGNKLQITLIDAGEFGWIYVGTQAKESDFPRYESAVFKPLIASLTLAP